MTKRFTIADIRHPIYENRLLEWELWRRTYESGTRYIELYLKQFTSREDGLDFRNRKDMTYCPAFSQMAVNEVKNAIFQRMVDVTREGGSKTYDQATDGDEFGVDLLGSSMNSFVGRKVIPELLVMSKVGVYVDMPQIDGALTLVETETKVTRPYLYMYTAEEILSWTHDQVSDPSEFSSVLLREEYNVYDDQYGLPNGTATRYRHMYLGDGGVYVSYYDQTGSMVDLDGNESVGPVFLNMPRIPFVVFQISDSLMTNIARYQVALMNLSSADMNYAIKSNFPFYTEQRDNRADSAYLRKPGQEAGGEAADAATAKGEEIKVGVVTGRTYPKGLNAPEFIHPSSEPLEVSMKKQEQLKEEIRQLVHLTLANIQSTTNIASAQAKSIDNQGLEAGLAYIGLALEHGERRIAQYWSMYEKTKPVASVKYPEKYSLETDTDRREKATQWGKLMPILPSKTYQKEIGKLIARTLIGQKVSKDIMQKIEKEIDNAKALNTDPQTIIQDVQAGFLDKNLAAELRGYPDGTSDKADKEFVERAKQIAISQAKGGGAGAAARGVPDASVDPAQDGSKEKAAAQDGSQDPSPASKVRGKGQPKPGE